MSKNKKTKYSGFTIVEMLITIIILGLIFAAISSLVVNMMRTSNVVSSRMMVREEGEHLAEVFRKYIRNSSADGVRMFYRNDPRIQFSDEYDLISIPSTGVNAPVAVPINGFATEIHFRPSGDTDNKVVCMGFFRYLDQGYIVRTVNYIPSTGSWDNYQASWCFPSTPNQALLKNFVILNSDLVNVEGLEIRRDRTSANVYYSIDLDMKPSWGVGGFSNYQDQEGAPKYRKSFVVQTRQLFHW